MIAGLAFLRSPLGRYVALGLATVAIVLGLRGHWIGVGVKQERVAEQARLEDARVKTAAREAVADKITDTAKTDLAKERVRVETVTRTLIQKVPVYVTKAADARCSVNNGFVLLHDAAASGSAAEVPGAAGGSVDAAGDLAAPSGVALSDVSRTVAENYGSANNWRAEAQAWRSWYSSQKAAWEAK